MSEGEEIPLLGQVVDLLRKTAQGSTGAPMGIALQAEKLAEELAGLDAWTEVGMNHHDDHWILTGKNAVTGSEQSLAFTFDEVNAGPLDLDRCMQNQISRLGNAIDLLASEVNPQVASQQAVALSALSKEYRETVYALGEMRDRGWLK